MKQRNVYKVIRFIFGIYLVWVAVNNLKRYSFYDASVKSAITNFSNDFSIDAIFNLFSINEYVPADKINAIKEYGINMEHLKNYSTELFFLMNISLLIGGLLCAFGFKIAFSFCLIGILLNIIFVHNFYYFRDEKMKVNVLKMLSLLGGIFFIA